jgi:hypothetical protein
MFTDQCQGQLNKITGALPINISQEKRVSSGILNKILGNQNFVDNTNKIIFNNKPSSSPKATTNSNVYLNKNDAQLTKKNLTGIKLPATLKKDSYQQIIKKKSNLKGLEKSIHRGNSKIAPLVKKQLVRTIGDELGVT